VQSVWVHRHILPVVMLDESERQEEALALPPAASQSAG
jgi:hypothetical protein